MYKKDRIKLYLALVLFSVIGICYFLDGKSDLTRTVVAISMVIWLGSMYFIKNKSREN